jgi:hypothetical protein
VTLRKILLFLVLAGALVAYLVVYELPQAEREATKDKLLSVDKDTITGVTLTYPDREIELVKGDKGWRIVRPVDAAADDAAVKSMLAMVVDAEVQRTLDDTAPDLAAFGLDKPNVVAKLTAKDASPPPISVGKNTSIGGKTYVRKGDEPKVYLTTNAIQTGLNKQAKDLRDKQILSFQDGDVMRVAIQRAGGETTTLVRGDAENWTVANGPARRPDRGALLPGVAPRRARGRLPRRRAAGPGAVRARPAPPLDHGRGQGQCRADARARRRAHRGKRDAGLRAAPGRAHGLRPRRTGRTARSTRARTSSATRRC